METIQTLITTSKMKNNKIRNNNRDIPWIEKYRPRNIDELFVNSNIKELIKKYIKNKSVPNIIFSGPPGIGKTSTVYLIARSLLGDKYNQGVLELNASDNRGIKDVEKCIEAFCKKQLILDDCYSPFKIILLDEADNMTKNAQQLINELIEEHYNSTRFIFTCNNSVAIEESIQSKCTILNYTRLSKEDITNKLKFICENENVLYDEEGLEMINYISRGDMRYAINNMELVSIGYKTINKENIMKISELPNPEIISNIFKECKNKNIKNALILLENMLQQGYSNFDILLSMIDVLKFQQIKELDKRTTINYLKHVSLSFIDVSSYIDDKIQLIGCIAHLCNK